MTLPIKYAHYLLNGVKQKFFPITTEEAVYDSSGGGTLKDKLLTLSENFGEPFNKETDYAVGDICIYLNRLYKFTSAKPAGEFDGTKVVPMNLVDVIEECNSFNNQFSLMDRRVKGYKTSQGNLEHFGVWTFPEYKKAGGNIPTTSQWGAIIQLTGQAAPGKGYGDNYYIAVDSGGRIHTGLKTNGSSTVTWSQKGS